MRAGERAFRKQAETLDGDGDEDLRVPPPYPLTATTAHPHLVELSQQDTRPLLIQISPTHPTGTRRRHRAPSIESNPPHTKSRTDMHPL